MYKSAFFHNDIHNDCCRKNKYYYNDGRLFSNKIELHTSDSHCILNCNQSAHINSPKVIHLEKNARVGLRVVILKETQISSQEIPRT